MTDLITYESSKGKYEAHLEAGAGGTPTTDQPFGSLPHRHRLLSPAPCPPVEAVGVQQLGAEGMALVLVVAALVPAQLHQQQARSLFQLPRYYLYPVALLRVV
jgi:hypothetical protein